MMRGAFDHPKFKLVARDLKLPMCYVRGIMESIWLVTGLNFPRGDIGGWDNEQIAIAIDYPGDADELIESLVKRRLLDRLPDNEGRLYVHDWHEHCDRHANLKLLKTHQSYANGAPARRKEHESEPERDGCALERQVTRENARERETPRKITTNGIPEPEPGPEPVPEPEPAGGQRAQGVEAPPARLSEADVALIRKALEQALRKRVSPKDPVLLSIASRWPEVAAPVIAVWILRKAEDAEAAGCRVQKLPYFKQAIEDLPAWMAANPTAVDNALVHCRQVYEPPPNSELQCQECEGFGFVHLNGFRMAEPSAQNMRAALQAGKITLCSCEQGATWRAVIA